MMECHVLDGLRWVVGISADGWAGDGGLMWSTVEVGMRKLKPTGKELLLEI